MTIFIIGIAACSAAAGAFGAVWVQEHWRQRTAPRELKSILDWRPTLRMDALAVGQAELSADDNVPANWMLQAEEIPGWWRAPAPIRVLRFAGVRLLVMRCATLSQHISGPEPTRSSSV